MIKFFLSFSFLFLPFLLLIRIGSSGAENITIYWGVTDIYWGVADDDGNLTETCATGKYSIVVIYYVSNSATSNGGGPQLHPPGHCDPPSSGCSKIGTHIKYCQKRGIKVMLYIAGRGWNDTVLSSTEGARNLSDYLWSNFLGGSSSSRPLGDAILDGIDFDLVYSSQHWEDLARFLKSHSTATQKVYLSATPFCPFPDYFQGTALETGLFDYVSIQFWEHPVCDYSGANVNNLLNAWQQWATSLNGSKIFLGLASSQVSSSYIPPDVLVSKVLPIVKKSPNYGGVSLWTWGNDKSSNYSKYIQLSSLCTPQSASNCRNHDRDFEERFGYMSTDGFKIYERVNLGAQCCEIICRNNCSCVAYAPVETNINIGCQLWRKGTKFIEAAGSKGQSIYVVKQKGNKWWIKLIIGVGASIALFLICYLCYVLRRKYKAEGERRMTQKKILLEIGGNAMLSMVYGKAKGNKKYQKSSDEVKIFSFESIEAATNNFSVSNKLGEGGFGPVYKGTLTDGQEVAIKRLSKNSSQGLIEFKNETKLVAELQHTNLVRLLGFCIQGDERILVYEYMSNKSLDFYLFDASRRNVLDWKKRFDIIEGIAQGLLYLHKYSRLKVIHRDLKASNILLDEEMNPKISDFGIARIFGLRGSEENTNRVVGTYGYMAPEYAMNGVVSIKIDVFSFGVLLLEILSGKKNNGHYGLDHRLNLIGYAWQLWNEGRALELIDSELNEPSAQNKVLRGIHIGLLCVQDQAKDRPSTVNVVSFLSNDTIQLAQPKQPAFFINAVEEESKLHNNTSEDHSINCVTISILDAGR